jgi:hypothetical protein
VGVHSFSITVTHMEGRAASIRLRTSRKITSMRCFAVEEVQKCSVSERNQIWTSHDGEDVHIGFWVVMPYGLVPVFRRDILLPSSGLKCTFPSIRPCFEIQHDHIIFPLAFQISLYVWMNKSLVVMVYLLSFLIVLLVCSVFLNILYNSAYSKDTIQFSRPAN